MSLIRDGLTLVLFLLGIMSYFSDNKNYLRKNNAIIAVFLLFIVWGLFSYFWREASEEQWLRGLRFAMTPILLLTTLLLFDFSVNQRKKVYWSAFIGSTIVCCLAVLEFFHIKMPFVTELSGEGALTAVHAVGGQFLRLQSILSGPNALGLYLLSAIALIIIMSRQINKKLLLLIPLFCFILLFTFSRSAWIGLFVTLLSISVLYLRKRYGALVASSCFIVILGLILFVSWIGYKSESLNSIVTHGASSTERVDQYKRVWAERYKIGFLGRGMGAAGPSSQNRIDGGPNRWTENIYLDTFEETGLVGIILLLLLLGSLAYRLHKAKENSIAFSLLIGFMVAGLFINIYTGQVGLYLMILIVGLALGEKNETNSN